MALSVLPGSHLAIKAHLLPTLPLNTVLLFMSLDYGVVFFFSPSFFSNLWIEMVMPPFSALLADSTR